MLEFLVLGQIPGTQIQITFAWYLFAALGTLAYIVHKAKHASDKKPRQLSFFK